jgi:2-polyprenyl-6-methoxyphenol hydroxylase-like FAD-dependent oxidoreductase
MVDQATQPGLGSGRAPDEAVLVVGAGPTGLMMAAELARHGLRPRLIDAAPEPSTRSRAIGVQARTLEIFEHLGIAGEALASGRPIHGVNLYAVAPEPGASGKRVAHVDFDDLDSPYPFILSLPQSETERILTQHAARLGVTVERNVRLRELAQDDEHVTAILDHADGRAEACKVRWLLGCDGAHSVVRKATGVPFEGVRYDEEFVLADLVLEWDRPDDEAHSFLASDGAMVMLPLPGATGSWRLIADMTTTSAGQPGAQPSLPWLQTLVEKRGARDAVLREATWTSTFRVHRRIVPRYRHRRVLLAGDAAHIHSPVGGQGMNTGLQDAHNLAWKLALVEQGAAAPGLVDTYHVERHPVAAGTLQGTDLATRMVTLRNPVGREIRDRMGAFLTSLEVVQRRLTRATAELDLSYAKSPIVAEERASLLGAHLVHDPDVETPSLASWMDFGAGPRAGDRAPDVELGPPAARQRLFSILHGAWPAAGGAAGGGHGLLAFDGAAHTPEGYARFQAIVDAVTARWPARVAVHLVVQRAAPPERLEHSGAVLLDPDGALHRRYGAGAECVYVVRPDGYIGYRAQPLDIDKLLRWLARTLL